MLNCSKICYGWVAFWLGIVTMKHMKAFNNKKCGFLDFSVQ